MLIRVVDNNTNAVITQAYTNEFTQAMIKYVDNFRRTYNNATIEWYYSNNANGRPTTKYKTFH